LPHGLAEGLADASSLGVHGHATAGSGGQPILLVDDDELVLATLRDMLQQQGHDVTTASSADAGLALLQESRTRFHAVISDWYMPGRDGTAIAAGAKLANRGTATILLTGRLPPRGEAAHKAPPFVDEILIKPVSHADLLRVLSPGPSHRLDVHDDATGRRRLR
jgi:CheY-like chemotaxis protein